MSVQSALYRSSGGSPLEFVSNILKSQFGNSEEFLAFERHFYYQTEELNSTKNNCEQLRAMVSKLQEEKRSMELQLLTEKALREQEGRNATMEIEKNMVQQNAQMYTMKCETESWKRRAEAITTECTWLKEQMRNVETEKNQAIQKLAELKSTLHEFERYRQSFESYASRQRESIQMANMKLDELEKAKQCLTKLVESNQQQLDKMALSLRNWNEDRRKNQRKIAELENELIKTKAILVQDNAKLARAEMAEQKTAQLLDKLVEENKDLHEGLTVLSTALSSDIQDTDKKFLDRIQQFHDQINSSVKRLQLNEFQITPPSKPFS